MTEWKGKISKEDAIRLFDSATDQDDPYWEYLVEDYYDEETDTLPSIFHFMQALGVTKEEYEKAAGGSILNWPTSTQEDV